MEEKHTKLPLEPEDTFGSEEATLEKELTEKVGVPVDYSTMTLLNFLKFFIFSAIGIWVFFIPITVGGSSSTPMVHMIGWVKSVLGPAKNWLVLITCVGLAITYTLSKFKTSDALAKFHAKDGWFTGILYYLAAAFAIMIQFQAGPEQILKTDVGPDAMSLAGSCLFTVTIAGWLVTFLIEFGVLEFLGTLMEPIMRRCFKIPGQSAVDALSSFVAAPAVGVFITNRLYNENIYTEKEACCISTNFSVVSLGFFALLVSITGTPEMYGNAVLCSLIIVFILAAIVIRIPPLSRKKSVYRNGVVQTAEMAKPGRYTSDIFKKAFAAATTKASKTKYSVFLTSIPDVLSFALKIVAFVQSIAVISLYLSIYTPVFTWIGMPMIPYLHLVQMPDAAAIAPATLVGIAEIALPVMTIAGQSIAPMSIFFVIVLSTVQIIFFTESANAMMQADMGLKFGELVIIFLIRTVIAIPIVSMFAHLFYM
ncbi:MAG: YjiH family protein [Lawsonibacter sp.]